MIKTKFKRVLSIILAILMVVGTIAFTPQEACEVKAAETATVKNINLGTVGFSKPSRSYDGTWIGSKVYFGSDTEENLWRVLDATNGLLFADDVIEQKLRYSDISSDWDSSELKAWLNGNEYKTNSSKFSAIEQKAIDSNTDGDMRILTTSDVKNKEYGFRDTEKEEKTRAASHWWWLRTSTTNDEYYLDGVFGSGYISTDRFYIYQSDCYVRPAFNLKLSSVLFSSVSTADKSSFAEVGEDKVNTNTWKLTLKDSSKKVSVTSGKSVLLSGQTIVVPYTYEGDDVSQISIMITDKAYTESDASILYYGALDTTLAATGTGTFELPANLPGGCKIYMMAEDVNDGNLTDYSSEPVEITNDITTVDPKDRHIITITNPKDSHITLSEAKGNGAETQTVFLGAMTSVVYTAEDGYYFPTTYSVAGSNGITVSRNSYTQITVAGTPIATTAITLVAATEKESQAAPSVTDGGDKIRGTTTAMEYASSESATTWETCGDGTTTVTAGTWYVRYAATDTKKAGAVASVEVTTIPTTYAVTVNNGKGNGSYEAGKTVTITADEAPSGQEFDKWMVVSGGITLASATSSTTSFEMPANAVKVTATYKNKPSDPNPPVPTTYAVTVNNGTGDGSYAAGTTVTITADEAPSGQEFDKWMVVSGEVIFASSTSATTKFTMPINEVVVTATYKDKPTTPNPPTPTTYAVTVNNGTGDGSYAAGATVTITADEAPSGQEFDKWTVVSGGVTLASATRATTFTMPANAVVVTANYKEAGVSIAQTNVSDVFNKTYIVNSMKYKVTNTDTKGTVTLIGTTKKKTDKKFASLSVGSTVKIGGVSYKITAIGDNAFKGYKKIKKVTIGNNVSTIGKSAFSGCSAITAITLGTRVKSIKASTFYNCKKLSKLTIKSKELSSVGSKAIKNIKKNAIIDVPGSKVKAYKKLCKGSTGIKKTMKIK